MGPGLGPQETCDRVRWSIRKVTCVGTRRTLCHPRTLKIGRGRLLQSTLHWPIPGLTETGQRGESAAAHRHGRSRDSLRNAVESNSAKYQACRVSRRVATVAALQCSGQMRRCRQMETAAEASCGRGWTRAWEIVFPLDVSGRLQNLAASARGPPKRRGRLHGVVAQLAIAMLTVDRAAWHLCPSRSRVRLNIR